MDLSETKNLKADHEPAKLNDDALVLLKAANIIERDGHHKGWICNGDNASGPVCLLGAILRAIAGSSADWTQKHPAHASVVRLGSLVHPQLAYWNDDPATTKEEVIAKLRAVALGL